MNNMIDKYEDIYVRLRKCFEFSFGDGKKPGLISMDDVKRLVLARRREDITNDLPRNSLMEIPDNLFNALKETYISRDESYVSGEIGCAESPEEQLDGITNMALLMYLSNHLSKEYRKKAKQDVPQEKKELYKKNEKVLLNWKDIAMSDVISSIYVLSKTDEEYKDYFSYGMRQDDENTSTLVIDLPYIGQLCVHFGWEEKKDVILNRAKNTAMAIIEKKMEKDQISLNKMNEIQKDLYENGVIPEYEGKLYEYVGAIPIEYIGNKTKKYKNEIENKLPEEITKEDIQKLSDKGLNDRELYYFLIKIGAPKNILQQIGKEKQNEIITPKAIENATKDVTLEEFKEATKNLKDLVLNKNQEKIHDGKDK